MTTHSPLGASGAERWMQCPGSVALLRELTITAESDAPDYRRDGTAAHAAAAYLVTHPSFEAWELIGQKFEDGANGEIELDAEMATAIQLYHDTLKPSIAASDEAGLRTMIEYPISSPVHKDFYGTCDCAVIVPGQGFHKQEDLEVTDFKYGEGIQVDAEENPQLMYYAFGVLQEAPDAVNVKLRIVQPRGFHEDGPVREWDTTAAHIRDWAENVLVPAMHRTELDNALDAGPWCRFCPAKLVCPLLSSLFKAACLANPKAVVKMSDESLGRSYQYTQAVKFYLKALEDEAYNRLNAGTYSGGVVKLVNKKARRVYKVGSPALFKSKFGDDAMEKPELKSPAEMEKISSEAKLLVKEYAYTPQTGTTVALLDDPRPAAKVQRPADVFKGAVAALTGATADDEDLFAPSTHELDIPAFLKREA